MIKFVRWWTGFFVLGVGGGGGDGGARQAAEQDEAKKARARNALNVMFGIAPNAEQISAEAGPAPVRAVVNPGGGVAPGGPAAFDPRQPNFSAPAKVAPKPVAAVAPAADPRIAAADKNRAAREADYDKIFADVVALNANNVGREHEIAARQNKFQLLRQGQRGGSLDFDQAALLKDANDRALFDASNRGSTARTGARQTDESARLQLLSQIASGADAGSVIASATRGMDTARQNAYDVAKGNLIEGAFDNAGLLYQDQQKAAGIKRGRELYQKMSGAQTPGGNAYAGSLS